MATIEEKEAAELNLYVDDAPQPEEVVAPEAFAEESSDQDFSLVGPQSDEVVAQPDPNFVFEGPQPEEEASSKDVDLKALELANKIVDKSNAGSDAAIARSTIEAPVQSFEAPVQSFEAPPQQLFEAPVQSFEATPQEVFEATPQIQQQSLVQPSKGFATVPVYDDATGTYIDRPVEGWVAEPTKDELADQEMLAAVTARTPEEKSTLSLLQDNIIAQRKIDVAEADFEAIQAEKLVARRAEIDVENAEKIEKDKVQLETAYSDFERANADLANLKIDPDQWYADSSVTQKILGALIIALSGYSAGRYGGENVGLKAFNKLISDDIALQVRNNQDKRASASKKKNLIGFYQDRLENTEQAVAAVKLKANSDAQARIMVNKAKNKGTQAELKADKLLIALQVDEARFKAEFARASMKQKYAAAKEDRANRQLNIGLVQNGRMLQADNPTDAIAARKVVSQRKAAKSAVLDINGYLNTYGVTDYLFPNSKTKAAMQAATTSLKASFRIMLVGPGTISDADRILINEALPSLGKIWGSVTGKDLARYNAMLERFMKTTDLDLETYTMNVDKTKVFQASAKYQDRQSGPAPKGGKK